MSDETLTLTIDGVEISARPGQSILEAAEDAGIYIPHLCRKKGLEPFNSCRLCTVLVNGRPQPSCVQPVAEGMVVESETEQLQAYRRSLLEMLFKEGNHFCPFCEKSGNCELQALAYRLGMTDPIHPFQWSQRDVDASHPDIWIDRNRCILCGRCVTASRDLDGKHVFEFVGRGAHKRVAVNAEAHLRDTNADVTDEACRVCPVGALQPKRVGYATPIGERAYDKKPIGADVEAGRDGGTD